MPDTTGSACLGKGRGSHVGQKHFEKAEKESPESLCYTSMPKSVSGDSGVDRTTTAAENWFWFCRITRTKRDDERRMNDLRKYVMQQNSSTGRLVRSKMKWPGHMVRMYADILVKRVEEKGEKTSMMQEKGNEQLRSKDCVRWDLRRSGEVERWRGGR